MNSVWLLALLAFAFFVSTARATTMDVRHDVNDDDDDGHIFPFLSHKNLLTRMHKENALLGVGYVEVRSRFSFEETERKLLAAIEKSPLTLMATFDHQTAAMSRDIPLQPTKVFVFGNPNVGTVLMQESTTGTLGIDLPQKMLVFEEGASVYVAYNSPSYLAQRHGITETNVMAQLQTVARVMGGLAATATHTQPAPVFSKGKIAEGTGLKHVAGSAAPDRVYYQLSSALKAAEPVNVPLELRHDANPVAMQRGLGFTGLVVFGNPSLGSHLIRSNQRIALDLPMKALVVENGTTALTYYNDVNFLLSRYGIRPVPQSPLADIVHKLETAIGNFINGAQQDKY